VLERSSRMLPSSSPVFGKAVLPNMRLKLAGGDRFKGRGVLCAGGHGLSSTTLAPAGGAPAAEARSVRQPLNHVRCWFALFASQAVLACASVSHSSAGAAEVRGRTSCSGLVSQDTTVYDTTRVSEKPFVRSGPRIEYPKDLRDRRVQGHVVLAAIVAVDGKVEASSITVLEGDHREFEAPAARWANGALFWPGCRSGLPVRVRIALPFDFRTRE